LSLTASIVEDAAVTWFGEQGYAVGHGLHLTSGERGGVHQFGVTPKGNANFTWVQHFIHHLAPQDMAGFVLANGSLSSNRSGEGAQLLKLVA
jgi:type I restriction-modification system DNA methylase subunit